MLPIEKQWTAGKQTNKQTNPQTWNHCWRSEDLRGFLPYFIWHADKVPCV